jgi:hypothetical protein
MTQVLFNIQKRLAQERGIFFFRGERLDDGVLHCKRPAVRAGCQGFERAILFLVQPPNRSLGPREIFANKNRSMITFSQRSFVGIPTLPSSAMRAQAEQLQHA